MMTAKDYLPERGASRTKGQPNEGQSLGKKNAPTYSIAAMRDAFSYLEENSLILLGAQQRLLRLRRREGDGKN